MENEQSDKIILACISFMVISLVINYFIPHDVWILRTIISLLWGAMPLLLSFAIKSKELRPIGTAGGAIYLAFQVYWQLKFATESNGWNF